MLRERLARETGLAPEVIRQLVGGGETELFEALTRQGHAASRVARLLIQDLPSVPLPDGGPERGLELSTLHDLLAAEEAGQFAKEGAPQVLAELSRGAPDVESAVRKAGLSGFTATELDAVVERIVAANETLVRSRGNDAFSPLMGDVMREVRGRRDGQEVAEALRRAIARRTADPVP